MVRGGLVLAEEQARSSVADALGAVGGEPGVLLFGEAVERSDGAQGGDDLGQRRGGRRGDWRD